MTDQEILEIDFYDLAGIGAIWYTDEEKIKLWRELFNQQKPTTNETK